MSINTYLSIPTAFKDDEYPEFIAVQRTLFNSIAGLEIFDILITEFNLEALLSRMPQIRVLDTFQLSNGKRLGLTVSNDEVIEGTHTYMPNITQLQSQLPDRETESGPIPRVYEDDDLHHWAGWPKRDFIS